MISYIIRFIIVFLLLIRVCESGDTDTKLPDLIPWGESFERTRIACYFADETDHFAVNQQLHLCILSDRAGGSTSPAFLHVSSTSGSNVQRLISVVEFAVANENTALETGWRTVDLSAMFDLSLPGEYTVQFLRPTEASMVRWEAASRARRRQRQNGEEVTVELPPLEYGLKSQVLRFTISE